MSVGEHRLIPLRHGETDRPKSGRHTGVIDLDLTEDGRAQVST